MIAGFWKWKVNSIEEAVEWLKRGPFGPGAELELRQFHEMEDFGEAASPEFKESESRMRKQLEQTTKGKEK